MYPLYEDVVYQNYINFKTLKKDLIFWKHILYSESGAAGDIMVSKLD